MDALAKAGEHSSLVSQDLVETGKADALQGSMTAHSAIEFDRLRMNRGDRRSFGGGKPIASFGLAAAFEAQRRGGQQIERNIVDFAGRALFQLELDFAYRVGRALPRRINAALVDRGL